MLLRMLGHHMQQGQGDTAQLTEAVRSCLMSDQGTGTMRPATCPQ